MFLISDYSGESIEFFYYTKRTCPVQLVKGLDKQANLRNQYSNETH